MPKRNYEDGGTGQLASCYFDKYVWPFWTNAFVNLDKYIFNWEKAFFNLDKYIFNLEKYLLVGSPLTTIPRRNYEDGWITPDI